MRGIGQDGDWTAWLASLLDAIMVQAKTDTHRVLGILELYERMRSRITELTRSQHALKVLDCLFDRPVFQSSDFLKRSGISRPTGLEFLRKLRDAGILHIIQEARGRRSALFAFRELLNVTEGRTVF